MMNNGYSSLSNGPQNSWLGHYTIKGKSFNTKVSTRTYFRKGGLILEGIFKVVSFSKECSNIYCISTFNLLCLKFAATSAIELKHSKLMMILKSLRKWFFTFYDNETELKLCSEIKPHLCRKDSWKYVFAPYAKFLGRTLAGHYTIKGQSFNTNVLS